MQNKNEKMIGTNCKKYRFWYGFGKSFGRFWEGLEGLKVRSKKRFFITSTRGMICLHCGRGWDAKMQPCSLKLRYYFWPQPVWKLLGGGNCFWNQIWKRFGEGLGGFWINFGFQVEPSWAQNGSQPLASTQNLVCYGNRPKLLVRYVGIFVC